MKTKNPQFRKDFQKFLEFGAYAVPPGKAVCAHQAARTLDEWRLAVNAGLVRMSSRPEEESYFDVFGDPETEEQRRAITAALDRMGCWCVYSEVWDGKAWVVADSIGMCV